MLLRMIRKKNKAVAGPKRPKVYGFSAPFRNDKPWKSAARHWDPGTKTAFTKLPTLSVDFLKPLTAGSVLASGST